MTVRLAGALGEKRCERLDEEARSGAQLLCGTDPPKITLDLATRVS